MTEFSFPLPSSLIASFSVPGEPTSKARARFTQYGSKTRTYTPEKTLAAEKKVGWHYRQNHGVQPSPEVTYGVLVEFVHATRQRRDVDNMVKLLLDGLNGLAWVDDSQVVEVMARKRLVASPSEARTDVGIYVVGEKSNRTAKCIECGKTYVTYPSWKGKRHCSNDCMLAQRRKARRRTCETCGTEWDPGKPSEARFCSRECKNEAGRVEIQCDHCRRRFSRQKCHVKAANFCTPACASAARDRSLSREAGTCSDCGGPTSKKKYQRCRACNAKANTRWNRIGRGDRPIEPVREDV